MPSGVKKGMAYGEMEKCRRAGKGTGLEIGKEEAIGFLSNGYIFRRRSGNRLRFRLLISEGYRHLPPQVGQFGSL